MVQFLEQLDALFISWPILVTDYAIFGSAVLSVHNIRENMDLDIIVNPIVYAMLAKQYQEVKKGLVIEVGDVEICSIDHYVDFFKDPSVLLQDCDIIDGKPYVKLKYLVEFKRKKGHEKDLRDIAMIETHEHASNK